MSRLKDNPLQHVEYRPVNLDTKRDPVNEDEVPTIGVRHFQIFLYFLLVFVGFAFRVALSIAIVAMTDPKASINPDVPTFQWKEKSVILSAFFWGYIIPQVFAGWAANRFGAKWFLVVSMAIQSVLGALIPYTASHYGAKGLIVNRALQGLCQGFLVPSLTHLMSQWAPTQERARLASLAMGGTMAGTVTAMFTTGLISASWYGWPMVFYLYGGIGIISCILFSIFAYNSPAVHPTISDAEKYYIEESLGHTDEKPTHRVPWRQIFTSVPLWALFITQCGNNYCFWTLLTQIPSYISHVMNFNIKNNSILSAVPYLTFWILGFVFSFISDHLINKKIIGISVSRKIFNTAGLVVPAIALIFLGFTSPEQVTQAIVFLVVAVAGNSAVVCGWTVNHMDLSPNHAGTLMGITNGFSNITAVFAPLIVQFVVTNEVDPLQWRTVFIIVASFNVVSALGFAVFGSGKVQPWNEDTPEK